MTHMHFNRDPLDTQFHRAQKAADVGILNRGAQWAERSRSLESRLLRIQGALLADCMALSNFLNLLSLNFII